MHMPSSSHWFGTDELGRDTWVRIMYGGRVSLAVGLTVGFSTVILGGLIGILAGYVGGVVDNALMRIVDVIYTIPRIVLLLVLSKLAGPRLAEHHYHSRRPGVDQCRPLGSQRRSFLPRTGVRVGGSMPRGVRAGASCCVICCRTPRAAHRRRDSGCRCGHPGGNDAEFSGTRHPAADAKLGKSY